MSKNIWEKRYLEKDRIAKYPFDQIVSMVMRHFSSVQDRSAIRILDYGSGGGNNFWFLVRERFDAYACDVSSAAINLTSRRLIEEGFNLPEKHFVVIDERGSMPYPDNFFSAIVDRESLCQSSWIDIKERVKEFSRILCPGGFYLGINFSCNHPGIKVADYQGNGDWNNFQTGLFKNQGSRHLFSVNEIQELFADWNIEFLVEKNVIGLIGNSEDLETSELIISAQILKKSGDL
jgi:ubiquinone/menaquinone biosynthesis C-methylase UbiE